MEILIVGLLAPTLGAVVGAIFAKIAVNKALRQCEESRTACEDRSSSLEALMMTAQARVAALEIELDKRIRVLESNNAC